MTIRTMHYAPKQKPKETFTAEATVIKRKRGKATVIELNGDRYIMENRRDRR